MSSSKMASASRLRTDSEDESGLESGEEIDYVDSLHQTADGPHTPHTEAMEKRKRGKVWQSVVLEDELSSCLSKVSTNDQRSRGVFVDLDAPVGCIQSDVACGISTNPGNQGSRPAVRKRGAQRSHEPQIGFCSAPADQSDAVRGEKRKNTQIPKAKRKSGEKMHSFVKHPDLSSEVADDDSVDIVMRKTAFQLKEKWNTWAIAQIVAHLGNAETRKLLQLTKTIEENGGMKTKLEDGRRSAGGVFITLFKSDAEKKLGKPAVKKLLAPPQGQRAKKKASKQKKQQAKKHVNAPMEPRKETATDTGDPAEQMCGTNAEDHSLQSNETLGEADTGVLGKKFHTEAAAPAAGVNGMDTDGIAESITW